jgi:5-(carboxyamino)imidazole ribonucleotide synthase
MILPGSTIGILGGGQLGRMLAFEARRMGYEVWALDPTPDSPCGQVANGQIVAPFDDLEAALKLAERCDVITYEFENVVVGVVQGLESRGIRVYPGSEVLRVAQNRLLEKEFFQNQGIGVADFLRIEDLSDIRKACREIGFPSVLKTISGGYDGKGQVVIRNGDEAVSAFHSLKALIGEGILVWERYVPFTKELGIICVRNDAGEVRTYPVSENTHKENILHLSIVPAAIPDRVAQETVRMARTISESIGLVGTMGVELFLLQDERILVNEIAPRPHNCGHYTLDACVISQFEQQLRAVCGLPLGTTKLLSPVAMVNILGEGSGDNLMGVEEALEDPQVKLHLYGKQEAKAKRKMGHLTALGKDQDEATKRVLAARAKLRWG